MQTDHLLFCYSFRQHILKREDESIISEDNQAEKDAALESHFTSEHNSYNVVQYNVNKFISRYRLCVGKEIHL